MEMVHPSMFVETVIEMNKDFDVYFIEEMIVSRVSPVDFDAIVSELSFHESSNEMNGAKYAINFIKAL